MPHRQHGTFLDRHTKVAALLDPKKTFCLARNASGQPKHPLWYSNLVANPELTVEYLGETYQARASTVPNSTDRDRLFERMSHEITGIYGYQDRCREQRQIPIVRLERI